MCVWGLVEIAVISVQTLALIGLFYLNYKNRQLARRGVANTEAAKESAAIISRVVGEPAPPVIPDPPPTKESDLERRVDK